MHVIFGAGPVGRAVAAALRAKGQPVRTLSRHPGGTDHLVGDVADPAFVARACEGATVVYQCLNAPYHRWEKFPALQAGVVRGARDVGARLVSFENLYPYGRPGGPMAEDHALAPCSKKGAIRARMIEELVALDEGGELAVAHVRASDLFGPGMGASALGDEIIGRAVAGRRPRAGGDLRAPHSWSFTADAGALLAEVGLGDATTGRAWHVPSSTRSFEEVALALSAILGRSVAMQSTPGWLLWALGFVVPEAGELVEMLYEFEGPFVVDSRATEARFGLQATPFEEALATTVAAFQADQRRAA